MKTISLKIKYLKQYTGLALVILLLCTGCIVSTDLMEGMESAKTIWFIVIAGLVLTWCALFFKGDVFSFNQLDWLVTLYFVFTLINNVFHQQFNRPANVELFCLLTTYFFIRHLFSSGLLPIKIYHVLILFFALGQILIAVLQWFELIPAYNINFKFTGFFFNPAPFVIFFTALLIYSLVGFFLTKSIILKYFSLFVFICGLPIILVAASRSAYIGLAVAALILVFVKYGGMLKLRKRGADIAKILAFSGILISVFFVANWLYLLKKDSADGRMLIWKLSGKMFADNFWAGVGSNSFPAEILKYQSQYFQAHPEKMATEGRLTDTVFYAFNDTLQLACEQGIAAPILFMLILIFAFKMLRSLMQHKQLSADQLTLIISAALSIVVIVISGIFSYPLKMLPVQIVFFASLAIISAHWSMVFKRQLVPSTYTIYITKGACLAIGTGLLFFTVSMYNGYKEGKIVKEQGYESGNMNKLTRYNWLLKNTYWYELQKCDYLLYTGDYKKAIVSLELIKPLSTGRVAYKTLGSLYAFEKKYAKAEDQYQFSYYALPALVEPKYQLAKFYYETAQQAKWKIAALELINFRPKIVSNAGDEMMAEIKQLYNKQHVK